MLFAAAFLAVVGPKFESRRMHRREHCAIEWLRDLASAQSQLQASGGSDADRDGVGDYGLFSEVAPFLREQKRGAQYANCICRTADLRHAFSQVERGRVRIHGYVFELWLPAKDGGWANEEDVRNGRVLDPDKCETTWICYAWPETVGSSGRSVFVCDAGGDVLACPNRDKRYGGDLAPVMGVTAFVRLDQGASLAANGADCLGDVWTVWG